jgi:hypothetical protein
MASIGNPHTVYNGAVSSQRNMFLSSSLAIVMIGFSDKFKNDFAVYLVRLMGVLIFFISVYIGFLSNYDFRFYLDSVKDELPGHIPIDNWYRLSYVVYLYSLILFVLGVLYLFWKVLY